MKDRYIFPAIMNYADDGISVSFPDLPGCLTCAHDTETALTRAKEALGLYLYDSEQCGEAIPEPSDIPDLALGEGDIPTLVDVFMPSIRDRINNRTVKKTLTIPAWLNREAEAAGVNFSQVLQDGLKRYLSV
ncbi:MAG: type II toxin-antitoxin system HicB family antitoxin [Clostridiales bacterium]|nr:type II toxin-antitoxin system HicB family antitoxin [Clostridiales bacterium]MCC8100054.1 type II toxin-antitoxin system HicB family antitoxin [Clostridiales bacterium]MCD8142321.1 type II toxin-antitoxin system HicB family antitoxin [Clostridiales bacterium]